MSYPGFNGLPDIRERLGVNEADIAALQASPVASPPDISDFTAALDGALNG